MENEKSSSSRPQNSPEPSGLLYILFSFFGFLLGRSFSRSSPTTTEKYRSAVSDSHETKAENYCCHLPIPLPVRAEIQFPEAVQGQQRTQYNRSHTLQVWLTVGTWLAFFAAAIYAGISLGVWHEMQKQSGIQREGQRAWVGYEALQIGRMEFAKYNPVSRELTFQVILRVKNFGKTPAFAENTSIHAFIQRDTVNRPDARWIFCVDGETAANKGDILFPDAVPTNTGDNVSYAFFVRDQPQVNRVWLLGCISYKNGLDEKTIHHTKFWLRSLHPDNATPIDGGDGFSYMPITGFESWGQETD